MSSSTDAVRRTAWLYTRGEQAVRLEMQDGSGVTRLLVFGPGNARGAFDFPDESALLEYQSTYERGLLDNGFALRVTADRRGDGAPKTPWDGVDRRRAT
jgi:hypothetical protein